MPWHILAPRAVACDSLHLRASAHLWHVSAFLCNREFLGISCYIKKSRKFLHFRAHSLALTGNYFLYTGTWPHSKAPGRKKRPEIHMQQQQHILFMSILPAFPIPVSPFRPSVIPRSCVSSSSELPVQIRWRYHTLHFLFCQYAFIIFKLESENSLSHL